jgi:hypothetical protein
MSYGRGHDPRTERMAKMLGAYRDRTTIGRTEDKLNQRWVEFPGLHALLMMHQTDAYFEAFQLPWQFIKEYQIDSEFHGVYEMIGADLKPTIPSKGRIWKAAYSTVGLC